MTLLTDLPFDNRFLRELPTDPTERPGSRLTPGVLAARVLPTPVRAPRLLAWSESLAADLGIHSPRPENTPHYAEIFSGNRLLPGMQPYATRYGGHQFGNWAGQLGDGRAISLGECLDPQGRHWEIQLKGAGPTPYSRRGDGRAVLRSSVREFLCSEAMHALGVPTTRALSLVSTGENVTRDMFYDGNPRAEPGAIVTRVAPTFLRLGHFEILAEQEEIPLLQQLVDHTLGAYFPALPREGGVVALFEEICLKTAVLMVHWLRVGFVHGVMNTDNLSILGLTIDYGPYGWLDAYEPEWTPNTTDAGRGRYRYSHQPSIGLWNLTRFAEALAPLLAEPSALHCGLELYRDTFQAELKKMMAAKLGWEAIRDAADEKILTDLETMLTSTEIDFTMFYRKLADLHLRMPNNREQLLRHFADVFYSADRPSSVDDAFAEWIERYVARAATETTTPQARLALMNATTPYFILRNYLAQQAIEKLEKGDRSEFDALARALRTPYEENDATRPYFSKRPEWARNKPGASALSCSS